MVTAVTDQVSRDVYAAVVLGCKMETQFRLRSLRNKKGARMKKLVLAFVLIAIVPLLTFCQQSPKSTASSGPTKARAHSLCPAPKTDGPGIGAQGMKVVYGHLAKLESFGPPIKFDDLDIKVELGNVSYGAGVSGNYAIPFTGRIPLLLKGAKAGDTSCQILLGNYFPDGRKGIPIDQKRAIYWYKQAYKLRRQWRCFQFGYALSEARRRWRGLPMVPAFSGGWRQ